jgi:hypothetical protein
MSRQVVDFHQRHPQVYAIVARSSLPASPPSRSASILCIESTEK